MGPQRASRRDQQLTWPDQDQNGVSPLLIVNADDFGATAECTDATADCYVTGGITSASAMVWMKDSSRAREVAEENGIPTGLHLNLTEPLSAPDVPRDVRIRQALLARYFASPARWIFNPVIQRTVERSIDEQMEQYLALYGRSPTHVDGHHHVHISPNVLAARALPVGTKMRPSLTFFKGEKWLLNRLIRHRLDARIARRFRSPRYLFSIRSLHPSLGGAGMRGKLVLAEQDVVEIMCHPAFEDERRILKSDSWLSTISVFNHGSYGDLR